MHSQRRQVIAELADQLRSRTDADVHEWFPAQQLTDRCFWFGVPVGDVDIPVLAGGAPLYRDDRFRVTVYAHWHQPGADPADAAAAAEDAVNVVEETVRAGKATGWSTDSLIHVIPVAVDGPGVEPHPNGEGWFGHVAVTLEAHCRLS